MARDAYVTRILARCWRELPEARQDDLAAQLGCDRSLVAHQLGERRKISVDDLEVWCDFLGTIEPLRAVARRLGHDVVPQPARPSPARLEHGGWELLARAGAFGAELGHALEDGAIDADEQARLAQQLRALRETVEGLLARVGGGA